jgi:hypothetical protein
VSKTGTYTEAKDRKKVKNCAGEAPLKSTTRRAGRVLRLSQSYGPFRGKPTDDTLADSKSETFRELDSDLTPPKDLVTVEKVEFSFTR